MTDAYLLLTFGEVGATGIREEDPETEMTVFGQYQSSGRLIKPVPVPS